MNRLMTWCIPDEALRWGRLTNDPFNLLYQVESGKLLKSWLNAQEPPPK